MIEHALRSQSRRIAEARAEKRTYENPNVPLTAENLASIFAGPETKAGVHVSESTAMKIAAVNACVRIIAESVASLPLIVYKRRDGRGKDRATGHPLYRLLHDRPNPELSSMRFRELMQAHMLTWGNAFAEIETNQAGTVIALWPLLPDRTQVKRLDGVRVYTTTLPDGSVQALPASRVFQLSGLGFDGLRGYSPIDMARESLGLTKAAEEFGARFFGQGATPSGMLEHPGKVTPEAAANLRASFQARQGGISNAHRLMILEEGMKWSATGVPNNHAQFLETRKFQVADIARWYRVPLHMLAQMEGGASFASVEQMSLEFVTYTLRPWLVRWEQDINFDLFGTREQSSMFAEHLVDGLLRGDLTSRYSAYAVARQWGWLSANDVLEIENRNGIGPQGDIYFVPMNMVPADQAAKPAEPKPEPTVPAEEAPPERSTYTGLLRDVGDRMVKRELSQLRKALKQGETAWTQGVEGVYREHIDVLARSLAPVFEALLAFGPREARALTRTAGPLALELAGAELSESRRALDLAGFAGAEALLTEWEGSRAESFAERGSLFIESLLNTKSHLRVA